jgi:hypothetical protein
MSDVTIPAELTLVLRRELVYQCELATEAAHAAAGAYLNSVLVRDDEPPDQMRERAALLTTKRKAILDLEDLFELLADDLVEGDDEQVPDDRPARVLIAELIDEAVSRLAHDVGDTPEEIIVEGRNMEALLALRAELEPEAVTA